MTNSFIDLSKNCAQSTIDCLTVLNDKTRELNIEFFVIGAQARILILEQYFDLPINVATLDIDIAITVIDWKHYEKLRESLVFSASFKQDAKIYHRLYFKDEHPVDLIPFGAVETTAGLIQWPPDQSVEMSVTGFQDALNNTIFVHLSDQLDVPFVSLPGMAVLKLIAWRDRHNEFPKKDAVDIAILLKYYADAGNDERLFDQHADLIAIADFDFELAGARMLGRDMAEMMSSQTKKAVLEILKCHANPESDDRLVLAVAEVIPNKDYEISLQLLQNLKFGILDKQSY